MNCPAMYCHWIVNGPKTTSSYLQMRYPNKGLQNDLILSLNLKQSYKHDHKTLINQPDTQFPVVYN